MEVLDAVGLAEHPPGFTDLLAATGLPRATLHRLLAALIEHGMVELSGEDRRYRGGMHLLTLAQRTWERLDLRTAAAAAIAELGRQTGETVHLAALSGDGIVYLDKVESIHPLRLHSAVGRRNPIYCTALGKAMAAFLDEAEQRALVLRIEFKRHTRGTLATPAALLKALSRIRAEGVAYDLEEHVVGNHCVAAPVFDFRGRCVGAISVTAPTLRVDREKLRGFEPRVREAAAATARRLGGKAPA
jgi:DNA-binding IclR family transcriptional regulator